MEYYFAYTLNPDSDEPIMLIDRFIGFDETEGYGIMGDVFQRELLILDGMDKKRIQVWINCPGGSVDDGYNIYNAMLKTKTKVDTYCYGMAASMAGVIFQAGRTRTMADYAWLMYHNPYSSTSGSSDMKVMETYTESLAKMIASRTGKSEDEIRTIMKKETYILADEALASGLCDKVEVSSDYNRKKALPTDATAFWKESSKMLNSILPKDVIIPSKNTDMKKVANKLKLNSEASEEAIVSEIESVQNRLSSTEQEVVTHLTTIKNKDSEIEKKEKALKDKQEECDKLKAELDKMKKDQEDADAKAKAKAAEETKAKAKNMIEGFVKEGRIKNEEKVITSWTEKAEADIEGVKNLIEGLPVNRTSPVNIVTTATNSSANKLTSVVRTAMVNKLAKLEGRPVE